MRILLLCFATLFLTSFKPGEPVATLTCRSVSGKTTFKAELPSCSYLGNAELSIEGSKLTFSENDKSNIIFDPGNKVLTIYLESQSTDPKTQKFLKFWALPATFKKLRGAKGAGGQFHDVYQFTAHLYSTDPRKLAEPNTKTIELLCSLEYEL